jgi:hypothetical protein
MAILNKLTWIDSTALTRFILSAQVRERMDAPRPSHSFLFVFLSLRLRNETTYF